MTFLKKQTSTTKGLSDLALIEKILTGKDKKEQRACQEDLYGRYVQKVYYRCVSIVKNKETAKDLAHDILVKMFLNLSKFKGAASFGSWLFSITYNHCINHLRKEKKLRVADIEPMKEYLANDEQSEEQQRLLEIRLTHLENIFQYLNEEEKLILLMRYRDGMSVKMIAATLEKGESAVKMRLKRSRDHLAKLFKEMNNE